MVPEVKPIKIIYCDTQCGDNYLISESQLLLTSQHYLIENRETDARAFILLVYQMCLPHSKLFK